MSTVRPSTRRVRRLERRTRRHCLGVRSSFFSLGCGSGSTELKLASALTGSVSHSSFYRGTLEVVHLDETNLVCLYLVVRARRRHESRRHSRRDPIVPVILSV